MDESIQTFSKDRWIARSRSSDKLPCLHLFFFGWCVSLATITAYFYENTTIPKKKKKQKNKKNLL